VCCSSRPGIRNSSPARQRDGPISRQLKLHRTVPRRGDGQVARRRWGCQKTHELQPCPMGDKQIVGATLGVRK